MVHMRAKIDLRDEYPVPDDATIQEMLDQFRLLSSTDARTPNFEFPTHANSNPSDLPAADQSYSIQDVVNGRTFDIRPIYYDALPFRGNPTKVFAWIGLPRVNLDDDPVPGMVCVHGGGGTAFKAWVEEWCKRGYAAISIAVEGQTDERLTPQPPTTKDCGLTDDDNNPHNKNPPYWVSHSHPGPRRPDVAYGDFDETLSNQWMFHCVADTILANTLMRSFASQVDPNRIGLTGISWGGVITSTVAGLDSRFSLVIPIYGCGDLGCANSYLGKGIQGHVEFYNKVWDACLYLPQATMPSLWISWPDDPHFPMINLKHSYEAMGSTRYAMVSLIPGLQHGHAVGWSRPESYTFAKYVWNRNSKRGWCHQISGDVVHHVGNTMAQVKFISALPFQRAELVSTNDDDNVQAGERTWQYSSCVLKSSATPSLWAAEAFLPQDTASWVINLYTGHDTTDGLVVTSTYQDLNLFAYAVMVDAMQVPEQPKAKGWFW